MKYQLIIKDLETGKQYGSQVEIGACVLEWYGDMSVYELMDETKENIVGVHRLFMEDKYGP